MRRVLGCPHALPSVLAAPEVDAGPVSHVNTCVRREIPVFDARSILDGTVSREVPGGALSALRQIADWLEGTVSRPHPALGRSGEVCPWTRRTIDLGKLLLAPIETDDAADADAVVLGLLERFSSLQPTSGADAGFRSVIGVFCRLDPGTAADFVVGVHARLKPTFLERGLMLGEFYPTNDKPGIRNPDFRPLRSPVPLLVVRMMVEADLEFLLDRDEFVEAYLKVQRGRGRERLVRLLEQRPATVAAERIPGLLRLADDYRDSVRPRRL